MGAKPELVGPAYHCLLLYLPLTLVASTVGLPASPKGHQPLLIESVG